MNENVFRNADEDEDFDSNCWSDVTLEEGQLAFHKWTKGLEWVSEHDGEYAPE
jgi:hypothetical protein